MTNWPSAGGTVRDVPTERGLRDIRKRGGEAERLLLETIKKGLPPTGKVGGVLKGELPNPEFAKEPAYKAELENETTARKEVDAILKGEGETEKASREAAVKAEKEAREAADALEKSKREEAVSTEKSAREAADNERIKGPASATESDIATYNGATGKIVKDSGKTIASVLLEAEETAKALASAAAAGLSIKNPVAYATTATLSAKVVTEKTIESTSKLEVDGNVLFAEGTRLLLKNQTLPAQNGVWTVTEDRAFGGTGKFGGGGKFAEGSGYLLTRATDADTAEEVKQGMFVLVTNGTTNKATSWILTTADPITIGTTAEEFSAFTAAPTGVAAGDLEGNYPNPLVKKEVLDNENVSNTAGIEYKKLNLAGKILGSDVATETIEGTDLAPNVITSSKVGDMGFGTRFSSVVYTAAASNAVGIANRMYFEPVVIPHMPSAITGIVYYVGGVSSGNVRVALYDSAGTRVVDKTASVAQSAANKMQQVPFNSTYAAEPGLYWMGIVFSSATATAFTAACIGATKVETRPEFTTAPSLAVPAAPQDELTVPLLMTY